MILKPRLPHIVSFKHEMELLEIWLSDDKKRLPKKLWRTQVSNWMKIAEEKAVARNVRNNRQWRPPKADLTVNEADSAIKSIKEILAK